MFDRINALSFEKFFSYCIIGLATLFILFCVLYNANWVLGDDVQFLFTTAIGKYGIGGYIGYGRMWPLGLWDYNILTLIPYGYTPLAHYIYNAITFLISVFFLLRLFENITEKKRYAHFLSCFFLLVLFISSGFIQINMEVIFAEHILILLISIFMYCSFRGQKTQKSKYYATALLLACYATYCKEPIFGVFAIIALTNLIFGSLTKKDKIFNLCLLLNSLTYIIAYYFLVWKNSASFYGDERRIITTIQLVKQIFHDEHVLYPVFFFATIRGYFLVFKKDRNYLFFDGLIFASAAYAIAFIFLKLGCAYYFAVCLVLAVPVFLHWSATYIENRKYLIILSIVAMSFLMIRDFEISKAAVNYLLRKRKNDMAVVEIIAQKVSENEKIVEVYDRSLEQMLPFYKTYRLEYFRAYVSDHLGKQTVIKISDNPTEIKNHSVLIYPLENYEGPMHKELFPWLERNNFTITAQADFTNVFALKSIRPLKIPFSYSFKPGVIDTDLIFSCFGEINKNGAISVTDSPVIKFKVGDNNKDLIVKCSVSLKNDTFVGEDVIIQVLVNDKIQSNFVIDRKSPQLIGVFIPKHLIGNDGMVAIKFQSINDLKTEKELNRSNSNIKRGLIFKDISIVYE